MKRLYHRALLALIALVGLTTVAFAADSPPPAAAWSLGEVMALVAIILAGAGTLVDAARALLHFTAPRTATTLDDRAAVRLDAAHDRIGKLEVALAGLGVGPAAIQPTAPSAPVTTNA